jgi:ankyrin repeat protein
MVCCSMNSIKKIERSGGVYLILFMYLMLNVIILHFNLATMATIKKARTAEILREIQNRMVSTTRSAKYVPLDTSVIGEAIAEELAQSCAHGNLSKVKRILESSRSPGIDVKISGWTCLQLASHFGHVSIVRYLIEQKADLTSRTNLSSFRPGCISGNPKGGQTALHLACRDYNFENMLQLIQAGANLDSRDNQNAAPLLWLLWGRMLRLHNDEFSEIDTLFLELLALGTDVNANSQYFNTPLNNARSHQDHEAVQILLNLGAN